MEKESIEKVIMQIYEAGYYNGKLGRDKNNFSVNKAVEEIKEALKPQSDSKSAQITAVEYESGWEPIPYKRKPRV